MADTKIKRQTVSLQSADISCLVAGDINNEAVLLLHGAGLDSAALSWEATIELLSERFYVVAPDWPGYGKSPATNESSTTPLLVSVLSELINSIGKPTVKICGLSMGGGIALAYTLDHQDRVERLVLTGSHGLNTKAPQHLVRYLFSHFPGLGKWAFAFARKRKQLSKSSLKSIFYDPSVASEQIMGNIMKELERPDAGRATLQWQRSELKLLGLKTVLLDRLDELKTPTLFLSGDSDALVPTEDTKKAHALVPGSYLHIIPNCGHWPQKEKPDEFHRVIIGFLECNQSLSAIEQA